jgi:MFS family permease
VNSAFRWYLGGVGSWYVGYGMGSILFPWLVAVVLHESPHRLGLAQLALMGPSTALLLIGGAVADRRDCRALLVRYHALALLPPVALGVAIVVDVISYPVVLAYGLAMGTLSAFIMPARDSLLTRMVTGGLPRAVALTAAAQFVFQLAGIALAGMAGYIGPVPLLAVQSLALGAGAVTAWRLRPAPPISSASAENRLAAIREGLHVVVRSPRILPIVVAIAAVGVFYVGAFVVVIPLLVRDAYGGGAAELAIVNFCFWGGTVAATLAQVGRRAVERPGRAILLSLTFGAVILAAMAVPSPFWMLVGLCTVWGMGGGVTMTQARTVAQLAAPGTHRARVLAVFQFGLLGGAALGAVVIGYIVGAVGPRQAVIYPAVAMTCVLAWLALGSSLWKQDALTSPAT